MSYLAQNSKFIHLIVHGYQFNLQNSVNPFQLVASLEGALSENEIAVSLYTTAHLHNNISIVFMWAPLYSKWRQLINTIFQYASLIFWKKVKHVIDCTPSAVKASSIYNAALEVDAHNSAQAYMMAVKDLDTTQLLESTPPTTPTETSPDIKLSPGKKKPGPCNLDQSAEFVVETNKSLDCFLEKMHNY